MQIGANYWGTGISCMEKDDICVPPLNGHSIFFISEYLYEKSNEQYNICFSYIRAKKIQIFWMRVHVH